MPLDFAAAICESETSPAGVLADAFFVEPPADGELEVAGAAGAVAAGVAAAALEFPPDDLLELLAVVFELSVVAVPESAALDFSLLFFRLLLAPVVPALAGSLEVPAESAVLGVSALFFLLLLVPAVLVLAGSLEVSAEVALASDFLLFLLLLFEVLLLVSELAELSEVAESDFFDFVLLFDEVESPLALVLPMVSSEVDFFFFLLLVVDVP